MRKLLVLLIIGCASLLQAQVIGVNPTPMATYYWNTSTNAWMVCTNSSTAEPYQSTPQAFAQYGFNGSLMQWTPQTSCPSGGGSTGLTSFQGRATAAAVLLNSDVNTVLQSATNCNVAGGYAYSPFSNTCILAGSGFTASGDLSGSSTSQTVIRIQGSPVSTTAPTNGQVLVWNTGLNQYVPGAPPTSGITDLTGAVTATGPGSSVATITPTGVTAGTYILGGVRIVVNTAGQFTAIGNPFALSISCTASGTYEVGATTTNPNVCTLGYANGSPVSASLTDGTNSVSLTSPYTTGSLPFSYCTIAQGISTFTFTANSTATDAQTASASTGSSCLPRNFGGLSTSSGSTNITASGNDAILNSGGGTISGTANGAGLYTSAVGNTFGPYTASSQYLYLFLVTNVSNPSGGSFTFNGLAFPMNALSPITFTNQNGGIVTLYPYRSTNILTTGTFTIVASN